MGCQLKRQEDGSFRGAKGKKVEIDVRSDSPASTVRLFYAGEEDGEAPFEITIQPGQHKLLIVAVGVDAKQRMRVVEVHGEEDCHLKNFFWTKKHFHTTLDIEGV